MGRTEAVNLRSVGGAEESEKLEVVDTEAEKSKPKKDKEDKEKRRRRREERKRREANKDGKDNNNSKDRREGDDKVVEDKENTPTNSNRPPTVGKAAGVRFDSVHLVELACYVHSDDVCSDGGPAYHLGSEVVTTEKVNINRYEKKRAFK